MKAQPESLATGATHNMSHDYLLQLPSSHPTLLLKSVQRYPPLAPTFLPQVENNISSIFFNQRVREREREDIMRCAKSKMINLIIRGLCNDISLKEMTNNKA